MNEPVYCEICGCSIFAYTEDRELVCKQCGKPIDQNDIEILPADTYYMN